MARYGQKGGDGPTKGRKAETLISPSTGIRKRVFNGQRWLNVYQRDEHSPCFVAAFASEKRAREVCNRVTGYDVHYVERAEVI